MKCNVSGNTNMTKTLWCFGLFLCLENWSPYTQILHKYARGVGVGEVYNKYYIKGIYEV